VTTILDVAGGGGCVATAPSDDDTATGALDDNGLGIPQEMQKKMQKKANEQRQADLRKDTEKLVKLSVELKQYVDQTNENVLSLDVIKKAEEIEKLARSVRTKMRGNDLGN